MKLLTKEGRWVAVLYNKNFRYYQHSLYELSVCRLE